MYGVYNSIRRAIVQLLILLEPQLKDTGDSNCSHCRATQNDSA